MSDDVNNSAGDGAEPVIPVTLAIKPECCICGFDRVLSDPLVLLGQDLAICGRCLENGRSVKPEGFFEALGCLHAMAMEIERVVETTGFTKALWAFRERFTAGAYRAKCPCSTCKDVEAGLYKNGPLEGPIAAPTKFVSPDEIGVIANRPDDHSLRVQLLATFNPDQVFIDRNGNKWTPREYLLNLRIQSSQHDTRHPGVKPGGLVDQAQAAVNLARQVNRDGVNRIWAHRPDRGGNSFGPIEKARRDIDDLVQRTWWADRARYGHQHAKLRDLARRRSLVEQWPHLHPDDGSEGSGYYEGPYWIDGTTGECFTLPEEF